MKNLVPLALLIGGVLAALYCASMFFTHLLGGGQYQNYALGYAVSSLFAVIGWKELVATEGEF
jgi:hypothetical protein